MYTEVVKIDAKGRITIPSYIRLLLNVDEGGKILMHVDEIRGMIMIRTFREEWARCKGILAKNDVVELMSRANIISINCVNEFSNREQFRCEIIAEGDSIPRDIAENIMCFSK